METDSNTSTPFIRALQSPKDFLPVADLIDLCFSATMDEDGRGFLRYLRKAGRKAQTTDWNSSIQEQVSYPFRGFVWEVEGKIVGNLSLISQMYQQRWYYLIANVAVHPDYRQQGIARALTLHAINHICTLGANEIWLQVRDDNPVALHLYESIGFNEVCRRDTWLAKARTQIAKNQSMLTGITTRKASDWPYQKAWLSKMYPVEVAWNFRFDCSRFQPGFWKTLSRIFNGIVLHHWAYRKDGVLQGFSTWEPTSHHADFLWLGVNPDVQDEAVSALLNYFITDFLSLRPVIVNYPSKQAQQAFIENGFNFQHTLIWMKYSRNSQSPENMGGNFLEG